MNNAKPSISSFDIHCFHEGTHHKSYEFLGCHLIKKNNVTGAHFALWAPNAVSVRVVGNFNDWDDETHPMVFDKSSGIWSLFIPKVQENDLYMYKVYDREGNAPLKSDPYAFFSQLRPNNASRVTDLTKYHWNDTNWMDQREHLCIYNSPINIYEVHLSSWKTHEDGSFYTYRELAHELADYVCDMGYTHIEILPLTEHPFDGSWGYQSTGYFSVTSRYGTPEDFMYLVDQFHQRSIGVILDWVPGHFCKDLHGLYRFDGTHLYENANPQKGENYDWGTANFDFEKSEIHSFLISNAVFWFDVYHIDGLRVDAVANMLYLNYGKKENSRLRNKYGRNENLEAVDFIKKMNEAVFKYFKNPLLIAEESTTWPMLTAPTYLGGLGFNYKWNMGWMNDMLKYMEMDPVFRKWHHNLITFSLLYAFSENFVLPLSHDEVVHGKKSLLDKMPGDYWQKFANLRLFYGYMIGHPGKKLLFMGGEFGQFIEWNFSQHLDWHLLLYPAHGELHSYVRTLNKLYKKESALWELDHSWEGFNWIDHQNYEQSIISFIRKGKNKRNFLIFICNFTPVVYYDYRVGVPYLAKYKEILNSDSKQFGGSDQIVDVFLQAQNENWNNQRYHVQTKIPPLATVILKPYYSLKKLKYTQRFKVVKTVF